MIFQNFNLLESKTVFENVAIPFVLNKTPKNEIEIKVTSETGDIRIYKINANFVLDDNNYLSNLTTNTGFEQEFSKELLEYTKTTEDSRITINATVESKNATYSITDSTGNIIDTFPQELTLGENIFFVNVTAQNGNVRTYKITINRNKSSDSKLSNLTTSEGLNEEFMISNSESTELFITSLDNFVKLLNKMNWDAKMIENKA